MVVFENGISGGTYLLELEPTTNRLRLTQTTTSTSGQVHHPQPIPIPSNFEDFLQKNNENEECINFVTSMMNRLNITTTPIPTQQNCKDPANEVPILTEVPSVEVIEETVMIATEPLEPSPKLFKPPCRSFKEVKIHTKNFC